jgi:microcystin degradation protein MlrC
MAEPTGDVDTNGDLIRRLRAAVGPDLAADVDPDEQVELAVDLLERARGPRPRAEFWGS